MNLTSPAQVKAWCVANGFHPSKALGQNFLIDRNILEAIVDTAGVAAGHHVLEIGPGLGVLTEELLRRGARVTAIEKDKRLAAHLTASLGSNPDLEILRADALEVDWDRLLGRGFEHCISNLPYSVGTRILMDLAQRTDAPHGITVLVQTEVAERLAAPPGGAVRGQAGVWIQLDYAVRLARRVGASCFWPRPEVSSSVVRLERRAAGLGSAERDYFFRLSRHAFMRRRKQLVAVLRQAPPPLACAPDELAERLAAAGIAPEARPESLTNEQWQDLARVYARAAPLRASE